MSEPRFIDVGAPAELLNGVPPSLAAWLDSHWQIFRSSAVARDIPVDFTSRQLEVLRETWIASPDIAARLARDPALFADLIRTERLDRTNHHGELRERLAAALNGVEEEATLMRAVRQFRSREMIRIACRDIAGLATLENTLAELTELAETCLDLTLARLHTWLAAKRGMPITHSGEPQRLVVIGMGKLGAWELNYSSDIDLIFAYEADGTLSDKHGTSYHEFFTRLARNLIKAIDAVTDDGFVFRVDMRLRPFGESGALVMSFDAMDRYYQGQAREWERYAMIKARPVAGDKAAGQRLLDSLKPFVYRRYLDFRAFGELRDLKSKIASELARREAADNIKLGWGGIREIEFIAQAFQLIRGGRIKRLQERRILAVLPALAELNLLPKALVERLVTAYHALRRVENRLQQYADRQTHSLPTDPEQRLRLAYALGYQDWESCTAWLAEIRETVHETFEQIFDAPQSDGTDAAPGLDWHTVGTESDLAQRFADRGYRDPEGFAAALTEFRQLPAIRHLTPRGAGELARLLPLVCEASNGTATPAATLRRIVELIAAVASRNVYLTLLAENPLALSQLVKLAAASPWVVHRLAKYPLLLDELLDPRTLYAPLTKTALREDLDRAMENIDRDDTEQYLAALRQFKQAQVLKVAAADLMGVLPIMVVSDYLTDIAEVLLDSVTRYAWQSIVQKHGAPPGRDSFEQCGFGVVAYGKFGGIELGYTSDLDLVFLYDSSGFGAMTQGSKPLSESQFFARLGQRIINIVTTNMHGGTLYEIDMRLRPNGNSGLLVASLEAYRTYQLTLAWTWEQQALVRARAIVGDARVTAEFREIRRASLSRTRDIDKLRQEVVDMRHKMRNAQPATQSDLFDLKHDPGGIVDIEFIVQFGVLAHAAVYPSLLKYTDAVRLLGELCDIGFLSPADAELLKRAYCGWRDQVHRLALLELPPKVPLAEFGKDRAAVRDAWRRLLNEPTR